MAKRSNGSDKSRELPPITAEARQDQMILKAMDLAQKKIDDGTASNQLIIHFLKLGSIKERKSLEILEAQRELYKAKTDALKAEQSTAEMYKDAMTAFASYTGESDDEYYDE